MRTTRLNVRRFFVVLSSIALLLGACDTDEVKQTLGFDNAPVARVLALVKFKQPVSTTVAAGPYSFLLHEDTGFSVLALGDKVADEPVTYGPFATRGRVLAVEYDDAARVAYVVDASGVVLIIDLSASTSIRVLSTLALPALDVRGTDAAKAPGTLQLTRNGQRLFVAVDRLLQPIFINRVGGVWSLVPEKSTRTLRPVRSLSASSGNLYLGFSGAEGSSIEAWTISVLGKLSRLGKFEVGGELRTVISRGAKVLVLSKTSGLTVIDFYRPRSPVVVYQNAEFADASAARLFGRTLLVSLADRQFVSALDVSNFAAPYVLTTNKGVLPLWISLIRGNLFMGDADSGTVAGIPPVLAASMPQRILEAMPLSAQIPVTFSKQIDPASLAFAGGVKLLCNGKPMDGSAWLSPDGFTVNFRPLVQLLLSQSCTLDFSGLRGWNDMPLATGPSGTTLDFKTVTQTTQVSPTTPGSDYPHTADGKFTDCVVAEPEGVDGEDAGTADEPNAVVADAGTGTGSDASTDGQCEWQDVQPAQGRYTYFYADFDGENLWILNDWFYNGEDINPDCYNQFQAWTGNGAERWEIRAYGDQHVEVTRNGEPIDAAAVGVEGGKFYGPSPSVPEPHTIYEIKIPAQAGGWGVQLHDPGPTFQCEHLENDTTALSGTVVRGQQGGSISADTVVTVPTEPTLRSPLDESTEQPIDVELSWTDSNDASNYVYYRVEVATDAAFTQRVVDVTTWNKAYTPGRGVLVADTDYFWRVTAQNQAGSATSMPFTFTTTKTPSYQLTTAVYGQGSVVSNESPRNIDCGGSNAQCAASYTLGSTVTLMARPAEGWEFSGWSGACAGTATSLDIEISGDQYCAAVFTAPNGSVTLWTSRSGSGYGSIQSAPAGIDCGGDCSEAFPKGVGVRLIATPAEGHTFAGWQGDCSGASAETWVTLDADSYCTAVFNAPLPGQYTLNVSTSQGGSVTSDVGSLDCPASTCNAAYEPGTSVTLTAKPASGYRFDGWTGDCAASASSTTARVTLSTYRYCGATFSSNTPKLDVVVTGPGQVTSIPAGISCTSSGGNNCSRTFPRDAQVTLTAAATGGGAFAGWSGDCSGSSTSTTVTMDRAKTCYASFQQSALSVYVSGQGTVTGNRGGISCTNGSGTCSANLAAGTSVTLTATPADGYAFSGWSGDCSGTAVSTSVSVTGSKSCTASFVTRTLNVYVTGTGTVTSNPAGISCTTSGGNGCSKNYASATEVQLTAAPGQEYVFVGWSGCSSSTSATISVNVNNSLQCYASFASNNNTLLIYSSGNGSGSVASTPAGVSCTITTGSATGTCSGIYAYNQEVTLTATPATAKDYFTGWSGNCQGTTTTTTVTMAGSRYCYATFQKNRLTLSVGSGQGSITGNKGSLSCNNQGGTCSADFNVGTVVQLTAAPSTNYSFTNWGGCSSSTNPVINVTVDAAKSCYAYFNTYTLSTYVNPAAGGTISSTDDRINCSSYGGTGCTTNYASSSQVVQLTAAPSGNTYVFTGWSGCSQSTSTTINVTMSSSQSCSANFEERRLTAYVNTGAGTITSNVGGISCTTYGGNGCTATFTSNTEVQLTAAPGTNHYFSSWSGACSGTNAVTTVTVDRARSCYATFTSNVLTILDAGGGGGGTVTSSPGAINCTDGTGTCTQFYNNNTQVTLTAAPSVGSLFSNWSGSCSGTNPEVTVTMTGNRTCYAVFTPQPYTAQVTVIGNGGVTTNINGLSCGGDCSQDIQFGTSITATAIAFPGETFTGWSGDCALFVAPTTTPSFTVDMPAQSVSCTATFSTNTSPDFAATFSTSTYDTAQCTTWNTFRGDLGGTVNYTEVRVRGSANTTGLTCTGSQANTICQALRTGATVSAVSCGGSYWDVGGCSSTTELHVGPTNTGVCNCGGTGHFTVRPCFPSVAYSGYGSSCPASTAQTLTVDCIPASLSVSVSGAGTVSSTPVGIDCPGDCSQDFANSTEVTLTAVAAQGETFLGWGGDCDAAGTNPEAMVSASTSSPVLCTAQFSSSRPTVLLLSADASAAATTLQSALLATDAFTSVEVWSTSSQPAVPTVQELQAYDVVMVWTSNSFAGGGATLGDNLADYYDEGGRVVVATYALGGHSFAGRFATAGNGYILLDPAGSYGQCSGTTLGTVAEPANALMQGVTSVGAANACAKGAIVNNGVVVASWTGGDPMVIRGTVQTRKRVDLNLLPQSLSGDSVTLIKNALLYQ